jgi:hypothetical protein
MRRAASLISAVLLTLVAPAAARAATIEASPAVDRRCDDRLRLGAEGVATEQRTADRTGILTVKLDGEEGDWDLGLFEADGTPVSASTSFGAREQAVAYVTAGQTLVAQACRRSGDERSADLTFDLFGYDPSADSEVARLVRVDFAAGQTLADLEATGLDVTHARDMGGADVVLYGDDDVERLRAAGFAFEIEIADLAAADAQQAERDERFARGTASTGLPSGRTAYRTLADYSTDLKALADDHAAIVQPVTPPRGSELDPGAIGLSFEGRPIEGIEITENAAVENDGKPVLTLLGLHHAREWPSGEMPMEFATDLVERYEANDPRVRDLLSRVRVVVLPVMNPDGFRVSRSFGYNPATDNTGAPQGAVEANAYKRRNCRPTAVGADPGSPCESRPGQGVDLNRNYGAYWGGIGSSGNRTSAAYRGTAPYSEPESEAFHQWSQDRSPVTVVSHHTYTDEGTWLRQPGFCMWGPSGCQEEHDVVPDEAGMKALGDAMGDATGWLSQLGWAIGEITGATEDWNYFASAAYGYTPEQRGVNFHPDYATAVVAEYDGSGPGANGGVREALLRATEQAADDEQHSVLTGTAEPGATLRLSKRFTTPTSQDGVRVDDELELELTVPADGTFEWDVNPSSRPLVDGTEAYAFSCVVGVAHGAPRSRCSSTRGRARRGSSARAASRSRARRQAAAGAARRSASSSTAIGRAKRKPWPRWQPMSRSSLSCSGFSIPSAIVSSWSSRPRPTSARVRRASAPSPDMISSRSSLRMSTGNERR